MRESKVRTMADSNQSSGSSAGAGKVRSKTSVEDAKRRRAPSLKPAAPSPEEPGRRLDRILRALPEAELNGLIKRIGVRVDPAKRIDIPTQLARALVGLPELQDLGRLPPASRSLLLRLAEQGGRLLVPSLPAGVEALVKRGIVYGRRFEHAIELVLPTAFLVQLQSWDGEDPRSLRALIAQAPLETMSAIAAHYLGRPATPPVTLSLESAWEVLCDEVQMRAELEALPPVERRLLNSIEEVGGEVDTEELLDLEREPLRLRGVTGVTASRRGVGFALERRAFLIPVHPNRHVIPTEVARFVGLERRQLREQAREEIRSFVLEEDHAPRRARFALNPAPLALAMAIAAREPSVDVRPGVGTPRSLVMRMAQRFGRPHDVVALMAALSRAVGLWEPSAMSVAAPPGCVSLEDLTPALYRAWLRGGAWDEGRQDGELLRVPPEHRDASPCGILRELVLEALRELGDGRWVPLSSLVGYLAADARMQGVRRLLRRWAERAGVEAPDAGAIVRRIVLETLPALGFLDVGGPSDDAIAGADPSADAELSLRVTPRGKVTLMETQPSRAPERGHFVNSQAVRVGNGTLVAQVLGLSYFAEIGRVADEIDLLLTPASLARALSTGLDGDSMRGRIEAVAEMPESISQMLIQASAVIGRASLVRSGGFLWISDDEIRELLRTRRPAAELFVDPSPPGGLLVGAEVDAESLVRKCRALGVEVECDGEVLRARPAQRTSATSDPARSATRPKSKASGKSSPRVQRAR